MSPCCLCSASSSFSCSCQSLIDCGASVFFAIDGDALHTATSKRCSFGTRHGSLTTKNTFSCPEAHVSRMTRRFSTFSRADITRTTKGSDIRRRESAFLLLLAGRGSSNLGSSRGKSKAFPFQDQRAAFIPAKSYSRLTQYNIHAKITLVTTRRCRFIDDEVEKDRAVVVLSRLLTTSTTAGSRFFNCFCEMLSSPLPISSICGNCNANAAHDILYDI